MDRLLEQLDRSFGDGPPLPPVDSHVAAGRRALRRHRVASGSGPWRRERAGRDGHDPAARPGLPTEERSALFDALQDLPTMQRKVVALRHWLGLSVEETASELGIATGAVKSHSSRGIES